MSVQNVIFAPGRHPLGGTEDFIFAVDSRPQQMKLQEHALLKRTFIHSQDPKDAGLSFFQNVCLLKGIFQYCFDSWNSICFTPLLRVFGISLWSLPGSQTSLKPCHSKCGPGPEADGSLLEVQSSGFCINESFLKSETLGPRSVKLLYKFHMKT